ncbi:MAG: hypothetical protein ACOCZ7_01725, partial [Armatimonadota bacterium]
GGVMVAQESAPPTTNGMVARTAVLPMAVSLLLTATIASADLPTITVEAEDYSEVTGGTVRIIDREDASGGRCVSYWEEPGVAVTLEFDVAEAGEYCLTLGYALNWPDARREVRVDGAVVPGLEDLTLPTTGSWADFGAITLQGPDGGRARIPLEAGRHTLTLTNVDSRGLAWDYAALHDPDTLLADVPLSDEELREFAEALPPGAGELLLHGPEGAFLTHGDVAIALQSEAPLAMVVGNVFFAVPEDVTSLGDLEVQRVGPLKALVIRVPDEHPPLGLTVVTNGNSCLLLTAFESAEPVEGEPNHLPSPLVAWRDGRPWRLAPEPMQGRLERDSRGRSLLVDGVRASVDRGLTASVRSEPIPHLAFAWEPLRNGRLTVAGAKVGPSILPADTRIGARVEEGDVVVASSVDMPPALAQFYGIAQFEVRVHPDASMTVTADSGETLELPAP